MQVKSAGPHLADAGHMGIEVMQVQGHMPGLLLQALSQHGQANGTCRWLGVQQPGLGSLQQHHTRNPHMALFLIDRLDSSSYNTC